MARNSGRKVVCLICGRKGKIAIAKSGRIVGKRWKFFGVFNIDAEAGEGFYRAAESGFAEPRQEFRVQASTPRVPIEYWECESCFRDLEKLLK